MAASSRAILGDDNDFIHLDLCQFNVAMPTMMNSFANEKPIFGARTNIIFCSILGDVDGGAAKTILC